MNTIKKWGIISICFVLTSGLCLYYFHTGSFLERLLYADLAAVEKMVASGANIRQTKQGMGALHLLAKIKCFRSNDAKKGALDYGEYVKIADYLINAGLNPDALDKEGNAPIHYALSFSYFEMAQMLIEKGADIHQKDANGYSPLHLAILSRAPIAILQLLMQKGANVNAKDPSGSTPLHEAVINGDMNAVEILTDSGADIKTRDDMDDTPYDLAIAFKKEDIVQFFQKKFGENGEN